jgi:protein-S-isoprenylcysteine O-methyltransferase Ste14
MSKRDERAREVDGVTASGGRNAAVRIEPPFLWIIFLIAARLLERGFSLPTSSMLIRWIGVGVVLAGVLPGLLAIWYFFRAGTTLHPRGSVSALQTTGPFRYSRNPIYISYFCALIGIPLALGSFWGAVLAPAFVVAMNRLVIEPEERYLQGKFPDQYTAYVKRVRRWI